jgi:hypothetical protein
MLDVQSQVLGSAARLRGTTPINVAVSALMSVQKLRAKPAGEDELRAFWISLSRNLRFRPIAPSAFHPARPRLPCRALGECYP